jgi:nitric oxide reductase NorD protein
VYDFAAMTAHSPFTAAQLEALILLAESVETLGDRYAIYGFSGWTRKRCEVFPVKAFEGRWDNAARGRVCAIEPKDYTRMGAPIRHLTRLLQTVEARTKVLISLSDGKPDDYDPLYRGEYGIEDTRQAFFEARLQGVHPFCITIDEQGADYLPHMYGAASYIILDDVPSCHSRFPISIGG